MAEDSEFKQIAKKKFRLIYLPYLIVSISYILIFMFGYWLLAVKTNIIPQNMNIVLAFLPAILPFIPILIWLYPRIKLLDLTLLETKWILFYSNVDSYLGFYTMLTAIAIILPTYLSVHFIETFTGKLTQLDSISQINKNDLTKYYKIKHYYVDSVNFSSAIVKKAHISDLDKDDNNYYNESFTTFPILNSEGDTSKNYCYGWIGLNFKEFSPSEFVYLERIYNSNEYNSYLASAYNNRKYKSSNSIVLIPIRGQRYEKRYKNSLLAMVIFYLFFSGIWLFAVLFTDFDEHELKKFEKNEIIYGNKNLSELKKLMNPLRNYQFTITIVLINIAFYIILVFSGLNESYIDKHKLIKWGANYWPLIKDGQIWRLIVSIFIHNGMLHLIANAFLLMIMVVVEPMIKRKMIYLVYIIIGIISGLVSVIWDNSAITFGSEGALFGLYGIYMSKIFNFRKPNYFYISVFSIPLMCVFANLLTCVKIDLDLTPHLTGFICGLLVGWIFSKKIFKEQEEE